ncbi:hypothetical protein HNO88_003953 [Novosphingobium chloroacetimidivorans]|uniref:Ice-binding protein C-terminal domain-containing protein n=1 Tax=Novosphingobium chloroacetimidivorans TaxID=1428314 RepID=A0A7W7KD25_9SPHN|nr:PEPxxWA-CTERM sorting domain-containing protein [Novosphingobium chloroacetimidivorans]MBB4860609.1 hypothetical protein [Novosphingobium chloroacetimidivorans]
MHVRTKAPTRAKRLTSLLARGITGVALLCTTTQAQAAIFETVRVNNSRAFFFDTGYPGLDQAGSREQVFLPAPNGDGTIAELGIDLVGEASSGSFFFLHNNYCVGLCSTASRTMITFTLRNDGPAAENLRFDSLITPGHLARLGSTPGNAGFTFRVSQTVANFNTILYSANGQVTADGIELFTSDGRAFNGLNRVDSPFGSALDWGATDLNLNLLTIGAGQTSYVTYEAQYQSEMSDNCTNLQACSGVQVAFGDPRQNGGGTSRQSALVVDPARDIINRDYASFELPTSFVDASSPLPPRQELPAPLSYSGGFTPIAVPAVPEPATWMLLIMGFGLIGCQMRGRRLSNGGRADPAAMRIMLSV